MKNKTLVALAGLATISLNGIVFYAANATSTPNSVSIASAVKTAKWNPTVKLTYGKTSIVMELNSKLMTEANERRAKC